MGLADPMQVISPAYNLVLEYDLGRRRLAHIDFYRLDTLSASDTQMFTDILERPDCVVLVEWAGKFLADLADGYLSISMDRLSEPGARLITVQTIGEAPAYTHLIRNIESHAPALD